MKFTTKGRLILTLAAVLVLILGTMWVSNVEGDNLTEIQKDALRFTEPVVPQYDVTEVFFIVKINLHPDEETLLDQFEVDSNGKYDRVYSRLGGYSNMRFRDPKSIEVAMDEGLTDLYVCEINALKPAMYYASEWYTIGHEFGHCIYGAWHIPSIMEKDSEE